PALNTVRSDRKYGALANRAGVYAACTDGGSPDATARPICWAGSSSPWRNSASAGRCVLWALIARASLASVATPRPDTDGNGTYPVLPTTAEPLALTSDSTYGQFVANAAWP